MLLLLKKWSFCIRQTKNSWGNHRLIQEQGSLYFNARATECPAGITWGSALRINHICDKDVKTDHIFRGCCCVKSPGEAGFLHRLPQVFIVHLIYSKIRANIGTKYHASMLEESFKNSCGTSLTAPDSFWVGNEKLIAFMPSKYQTDRFVLTVVNTACQATRTGFLNKAKWRCSDPKNFHRDLCSRVMWQFCKTLFQKYILQAATWKEMADSTSTVRFSAIRVLTFWRLSGRTKLRTHNNRLCTNKSSNKIGFSCCRRSRSSENAEHFPL